MRTASKPSSTASGISTRRRKARLRIPIRLRDHPVVLVAEARGPFRGGNQRAVVRNNVQKIELLGLRDAARVVVILRSVGLRTIQVHGHAQRGFGVGDSLHAARDFVSALRVFPAKLRDQGVGALAVELFERPPRIDDTPQATSVTAATMVNGEKRQQLGAKAHCDAPRRRLAQARAKRLPGASRPSAAAIQSRTCGLSP